jgi:hypothetical protein
MSCIDYITDVDGDSVVSWIRCCVMQGGGTMAPLVLAGCLVNQMLIVALQDHHFFAFMRHQVTA